MSEDAVLQGGEGMLDRASSHAHDSRRGALSHALQSRLVQVNEDGTLCARCAATLQSTRAAGRFGRGIDHRTLVLAYLCALEALPGGTAQRVAGRVINELAAVEQRTVAPAVA